MARTAATVRLSAPSARPRHVAAVFVCALLAVGAGRAAAAAAAASQTAAAGGAGLTDAAADAEAHWTPLSLVPTPRAGVRARSDAAAAARLEARARRKLREQAYVLEGSTKLGYYTAPMKLGSPPRTFNVILDTGSSLTVVPCKSCDCGFHQSAPFDPDASLSVKKLSCSDAACPRERAVCNANTPGSTCQFYNMYAEGSSSGGAIVRDALQLPRPGNATAEVLGDFAFGCARFQTGQLYTQQADGVVGLSYGPVSLPTQLATAQAGGRRGAAPGAVSLCLGRRGGAMAIGRAARPAGAPAMQYVQLLPSVRGYYLLPVTQLLVGATPLAVEPAAWSPALELSPQHAAAVAAAGGPPADDPSGGGIIVDSGATFSYFATAVFEAFKRQLAAAVAPLAPPLAGAAAAPPSRRRVGQRLPRRRLAQAPGRVPPPARFAAPAAAADAAAGADDGPLMAGPGPRAGSVFVEPVPPPAGAAAYNGDDDICWSLSGPGIDAIRSEYDLGGIFPDLEIRFAGGASLHIPPQRYMHVAGRTGDGTPGSARLRACLGIFDGQDESILGAIMMRDAVWEFDHAGARRVGFADADCGLLGKDFVGH